MSLREGSAAFHQGAGQQHYAGAELLLRGERELANYNAWIVSMFARHVPRGCAERPLRVLDFGAGIGTLSRLFHERTGMRPEGVEIDPAQREIYASRGFVAYASLAQAQGAYDLIFTSNVLEHIEDDQAAIEAMERCLRPGGRLLVYVPAFKSIWTTLDDRVGHYRRYTRGELAHKLRQGSFTVTHSRYCDSLGFGLALVFKLVGSRQGEPSARALVFFDRCLLPLSRLLDVFTSRLFGKNVLAVAVKP